MADIGLVPDLKPIDPTESLMAVIGIGPALGDPMPKIGAGVMLDASRVARKIDSLARALVRGELPAYRMPKKEHSWDKLHRQLSKPLDAEALARISLGFVDAHTDVAGLFQTHCQNVHQQLADMFPVQEYKTFLGPKYMKPNDLSEFKFWSQYNVLNDPLSVMPLIASAAILKPQVEAMREFYPSTSDHIDSAIYAALAQAGLLKSFQMTQPVEQGIGVWLGRSTVAYDPDYGKVRKAPGPKPSTSKDNSDSLKTAQQKSINPP